MTPPRLTFCCELPGSQAFSLLTRADVTATLVRLGARLSLGLLDLSPERAQAIRHLTSSGVPVHAWLLLPAEQGYWSHCGNAEATMARYLEIAAWARRERLSFAGLDLDFEPSWAEMNHAAAGRWGRLALAAVRRGFGREALARARERYAQLVTRAGEDGYLVSAYLPPFLRDDAEGGATFVQRLLGVPRVGVAREISMLYSSLWGAHGAAALASYAPGCSAIAVGSTGGGVAFDRTGELRTLTFDELARDLRIARAHTDDLVIFSLEGCVQSGSLARLESIDWDAPPPAPDPRRARIDRVRRGLRSLLRAGRSRSDS